MGQIYIENSDDVFDPTTDWLEVITSMETPGYSSLSRDSQSATLQGFIPWNKQRSASSYFLGYATVDNNYNLHRQNQPGHPTLPWLRASEIDLHPFVPAPNPENNNVPNAPSPFWTDGINIATCQKAKATVKYRSFRYAFLDDSQITDPRLEWQRNLYIDMEPSVEALSADGVGQLTFAEGAPSGGPTATKSSFPAPVAELLGKASYVLTWVDLPFEYLSSEEDYFFPANILACLGKVNADEFPYGSSDPFDAGTLLFDSVRFTQKNFPVAAANPYFPLISVDVTMTLKYFQPDLFAADPIGEGHNNMPWKGGLLGDGVTPDPAGGKFGWCTRGGKPSGPPLLGSATFANIFVSPNA